MIYVFLDDGFEECEAISPIDVLRRAGFDVKTVGVGAKTVTGSHGIPVVCDICEDEAVFEDVEAVVLPGGMPGTLNLEKSATVQKFIDFAAENNLVLGAICAAPSILGHKGLLKNKNATCFTGFEKDLIQAQVVDLPVVIDGNIVTAYGAGAALNFGFALLEVLRGKEVAENMKKQMRFIG